MPDVKLQAIISAKDEASSKINGLNASFGKLTGAFAAGQLAADLFKKGLAFVVDTVKDSISEYLNAEKQLGQTNAILKTVNTSLAEQKNVFDAAGKAALAKAFDDEEAKLSLAKLYRATNDMKFSQESLTAAMDLARDKGMGLEEATNLLSLAYMGNMRALKPYGIELPDTASKFDVLQAVIKKTSGEAEEFTKTNTGKIALLTLSVGELKETFGQAVIMGISPYISSLTDAATKTNENLTATNKLGKIIYQTVGGVQSAAFAIESWGKGLALFIQGVYMGVLKVWEVMKEMPKLATPWKSIDTGWSNKITNELKVYTELQIDAGQSALSFDEALKRLKGEGWIDATAEDLAGLNAINKDYINSTLAAGNAQEQAAKAMDDAKKSAEELAKKLQEAKEKTEDFRLKLLDLRADSIVALKEMAASIEKDLVEETIRANDEVMKLNQTFEDAKQKLVEDSNTSIVKIIVDKEIEAADLQAQILASTNDEEKIKLQEKLDIINAFLLKHQDDYITYADQLKAYRDYYALDEIDKIKADNAEKLTLLIQDHTDKLALADQQHAENIEKINLQMEEIKVQIAKNMKTMFEDLVKSSEMTLIKNLMKEALKFGVTIDMRGAMEEMGFGYLGSMADVAAAKKAGKTVIQVGGSYYSSRQAGGYVQSGQPYMVGEKGAEMFVPNQAGQIIPNNKMGGAININFNNPVVRSENDFSRLISEVKRVLNREQVVAQLRI